jgi:hypothetical protein
MRSLATLGLLILSVLPLAARDHDHDSWRGRGSRRVVVVEGRPDRYDRFYGRYDRDDRYVRYDRDDRCERDDDRWEGRTCRDDRPRYRVYDDDVVVVRPRPLAPPWRSRIVFRFGW